MRRIFQILIAIILLGAVAMPAEARRKKTDKIENRNKSEFRGVWIQTAFQDRYMRMKPAETQRYLTQMVEKLHTAGFNAVLFQVRPEGDALYKSDIEPWSRFLTGRQGVAPVPEWDPMQFMIDLCHERHMEFHAWVNPYRMSASKNQVLPQEHLFYKHPEWFVNFEGKLYLNPGMPECRAYVRDVIKDIVGRYDVDALHIDDYFYPYPVRGKFFNDRDCFEAYAPQMHYDVGKAEDLENFRRQSVSILIKGIHDDIRELKPWVRFGVSPFGIYRNEKSWEGGSKTNGTQCYDDLYADILLWVEQGWVDYIIPQLYWEIGHKAADYTTLVNWWSEHTPDNCHLYIGQSIERSLDETSSKKKAQSDLRINHEQFGTKLLQARSCNNIRGNCYWYAYQIDENQYHVLDYLLDSVHVYKTVLPPSYRNVDAEAPEKVKDIEIRQADKGVVLSWKMLQTDDPLQEPRFFCVYRFEKGEHINIDNDCSHLLVRTPYTSFRDIGLEGRTGKFIYIVTAVDACNNESLAVRKTVKVK